MSSVPNTSLVVNQRGVDIFSEKDVVYLLAPAHAGGEKRDADNTPIVVNGRGVFEPKRFSGLSDFEQEFGLAANGSPASMYAKWIFDRGNYEIVCRRVVSDNLSYATATLKDEHGNPVINLRSNVAAYQSNNIMVDVTPTNEREMFFSVRNAVLDATRGVLTAAKNYNANDYLVMESLHYNTEMVFRVGFYGQSGQFSYSVLDFDVVTLSCRDKDYYSQPAEASALLPEQYVYNTATRELRFGSPPPAGTFNIKATVRSVAGILMDLWFNADGISTVYRTSFVGDEVELRALYVNGVGFEYDEKIIREARIFTTPSSITKNVTISCSDGTLPNTAKIIISGTNNGEIIRHNVYDNVKNLQDLFYRIKDYPNYLRQSELVDMELLTTDINTPIYMRFSNNVLPEYGYQLAIYTLGTYESYVGLRDAADVVRAINDESILVTAEILDGNGGAKLKNNILGLKLAGGHPGDDAQTLDYLIGLVEAETILDITIVIAPGVADIEFHAVMKEHCISCSRNGKYRICVVGGEIGETDDAKIARAIALSHERVCCLGDGLYLTDPRILERRLFAPSVAVAAFVGQLLSDKYYVCQTHKYIKNAYGVEHHYDDGALTAIREAGGRLIMFRFDSGVQIVDAITTSVYNAYEDLNMVRLYDVISRNIRQNIMKNVIGRSNLPVTWSAIISMIRRILDRLRDYGALESYVLLSDVAPQDYVERRYKFRIGLIPTFPVKYVEALVDILPPMFDES